MPKMNLDSLPENLQQAGLLGVTYTQSDFDTLEELRGGPVPFWYKDIATKFPIANLRYKFDSNVDLVIPHPIQLRLIASQDSRFHLHGDGDNSLFPFGIAPDDQSNPLWAIPADTTMKPVIWGYADYYSEAFEMDVSLSTILSKGTIIENVTSNPDILPDFDTRYTPSNIDGLRFEPSMPPDDTLNQLDQSSKGITRRST